ncbi:MAG: hypothetical protein V3T24_07315 [Longimicrobiales bacterium]
MREHNLPRQAVLALRTLRAGRPDGAASRRCRRAPVMDWLREPMTLGELGLVLAALAAGAVAGLLAL